MKFLRRLMSREEYDGFRTPGAPGELRVFVIAVGDSETILLKFPGGDLGVIDSCRESGEDDSVAANVVNQYLAFGESGRIRFVCLSHYGPRHFSGLAGLMGAGMLFTQESQPWFFHHGEMKLNEYRTLCATNGMPDLAEVEALERIIAGDPCAFEVRTFERNDFGNATSIHEDIDLEVISPRLDQPDVEDADGADSFRRAGLAFLLRYGEHVLLFADDVDAETWDGVIGATPAAAPVPPAWAKVSGYGTFQDFPPNMWPWLRGGREPTDWHSVIGGSGALEQTSAMGLAGKESTVYTTYDFSPGLLPAWTPTDNRVVADAWDRGRKAQWVCCCDFPSDGEPKPYQTTLELLPYLMVG